MPQTIQQLKISTKDRPKQDPPAEKNWSSEMTRILDSRLNELWLQTTSAVCEHKAKTTNIK